MVQLDKDELRLLGSYADGPRVWDAAAVFPLVLRLEAKGLVAMKGEGGLYGLTDEGRQELEGLTK
jgi:hypothetical protein